MVAFIFVIVAAVVYFSLNRSSRWMELNHKIDNKLKFGRKDLNRQINSYLEKIRTLQISSGFYVDEKLLKNQDASIDSLREHVKNLQAEYNDLSVRYDHYVRKDKEDKKKKKNRSRSSSSSSYDSYSSSSSSSDSYSSSSSDSWSSSSSSDWCGGGGSFSGGGSSDSW